MPERGIGTNLHAVLPAWIFGRLQRDLDLCLFAVQSSGASDFLA